MSPAERIGLLIDEGVPVSVSAFLADRGHETILVAESLGKGSSDDFIAKVGNREGLVVVTWDRDFRRMVRRMPISGAALRRLGRISFSCAEPRGRQRIEQVIDIVEFEFRQARTRADKRVLINISETTVTIIR